MAATAHRMPIAETAKLPQSDATFFATRLSGAFAVGPEIYRLRDARRCAKAAFKSSRNRSISNGLSIRGLFEVASFLPGKSVEAEPLLPPVPAEPYSPITDHPRPLGANSTATRFPGHPTLFNPIQLTPETSASTRV
jgi:hypothetical protein